MTNIEERVQRAVEEIAGNEALLEMLETDAAEEMLDWGKTLAASIVMGTQGMDDIAAEEATLPRLKAVRQTMRAVGNWAAGKYAVAETRVQLREKLKEYFRLIFGDHADPPAVDELDSLINQVDDPKNNPQQLVLKMKTLFKERNIGVSKNVS